MKKVIILCSTVFMLTMFFSLTDFTIPNEVNANAKVEAIEGMSYNVNASLHDNLTSLTGKKVYVTLDSGKTLAGTVKTVGKHLIHLEKLDKKDFFDALILIEDISAIDAKFRNYKR